MGIICAIQIAMLGILEQTHAAHAEQNMSKAESGSGAVEHCPPMDVDV